MAPALRSLEATAPSSGTLAPTRAYEPAGVVHSVVSGDVVPEADRYPMQRLLGRVDPRPPLRVALGGNGKGIRVDLRDGPQDGIDFEDPVNVGLHQIDADIAGFIAASSASYDMSRNPHRPHGLPSPVSALFISGQAPDTNPPIRSAMD
ncbi:hypothetical protein Trco_008258 [Trichoderma cornu-damae]|uniref:Uncharacterized protein n=1 Tax=Trichoderma cornu-damae TaxID=654480 RepID=A0A9P8QIC2_9HYPO|nr:hypothetical protein Trco_008258 [Trichoderma cornu-damae]